MKISNPYAKLDLNADFNANQLKEADLSYILDYQSKNPDHYILNFQPIHSFFHLINLF